MEKEEKEEKEEKTKKREKRKTTYPNKASNSASDVGLPNR